MKVQDMIAKCDESEVFTQNLEENIVSSAVKNGNGEITFRTDPQFVLERAAASAAHVAVVIWFPSDVFKR